jgi:hypothetical protein
MRWSLKLSELDFEIEQREGTKIPHVDALSRHVGAVANTGSLDREIVRIEQERDQFSKELHPGCFNSRNDFSYDAAGLIYRRRTNGKHQLLVPRTLVNEVIKQNHVPIYTGHPGVKRTYELVALSFWWPAMRRTTEEFISECGACQRGETVSLGPL